MEYSSKILHDHFLGRQRENPRYSLRSFARDVGLTPAVVSQVFSEKIRIPKRRAPKVADRLKLTPSTRKKFIESLQLPRTSKSYNDLQQLAIDQPALDEERDYKIIAEWEHYAIFSLMDTEDFQSNDQWIAKRFGISPLKVRDVLSRLEQAQLISKNSRGEWIKLVPVLTTTKEVPSSAIRSAHLEELQLTARAIEEVALDKRMIESATLAINEEDLDKIKDCYEDFCCKILEITKHSTSNQVYQFNIHAFPLSR